MKRSHGSDSDTNVCSVDYLIFFNTDALKSSKPSRKKQRRSKPSEVSIRECVMLPYGLDVSLGEFIYASALTFHPL